MGVPVTSGATCGTFLCGQRVCGEVNWTAPQDRPILTLVARAFVSFDEQPIFAAFGKPSLTLVARSIQIRVDQSPPLGKAILLLVARPTEGQPMLFAQMPMPTLELLARTFSPAASGAATMSKAILELLARDAVGRIAGLIPTEEVELILTPTVIEDGVFLTPVVESDLILVPTNEVVG